MMFVVQPPFARVPGRCSVPWGSFVDRTRPPFQPRTGGESPYHQENNKKPDQVQPLHHHASTLLGVMLTLRAKPCAGQRAVRLCLALLQFPEVAAHATARSTRA